MSTSRSANISFRGGRVSKAHRLVFHSTLGSRVIRKKKGFASGWTNISSGTSMDTRNRSRAKRERLTRFEGLLPESQGQNQAVTVLRVPDSGRDWLTCAVTGLYVPGVGVSTSGSANISSGTSIGTRNRIRHTSDSQGLIRQSRHK